MPTRDDDSQSLDPREYPEPDVDTEDAVLPCPNCLAVIHDETVRCPRCGEYLSESMRKKPLWLVIGAVVCLALVVFGLWLAHVAGVISFTDAIR
jgi:hypothetical protein